MKVVGIIPARMASTRFPGKPLVNIGGKSMIQRVYEQAKKSARLSEVYVATDHEAIGAEVHSFKGKVLMTASHHVNGTERCAEALSLLKENFDILVNIQGDEPFFEVDSLESLLDCFQDKTVGIATLTKSITDAIDIENPSVVKVAFNKHHDALYFSRAAIPFHRDVNVHEYFKHIGIYAFRTSVLKDLVKLEASRLENIEKLEQLRWLENGYKIKLGFTDHDSNSVDTPEDLDALKKQFKIQD